VFLVLKANGDLKKPELKMNPETKGDLKKPELKMSPG
jgi:hypothetical protein